MVSRSRTGRSVGRPHAGDSGNGRPPWLRADRRRDTWWAAPLVVFVGLSAFVVYATWAAFQNEHYTFGPYLSPFYSPEMFGDSPHAWFGPRPGWWPAALPFSPALLILPFPGLFRFTCYYYRGAYYKAFWADPPSCAVGEPRTGYRGEHSFPLILQNAHRFFMWVAMVFIVLPGLRRVEGDVVHESGDRRRAIRHRRRHDRARGERRAARQLHVGLPRRCATSSAAGSTRSRSRRSATCAYACVSGLNGRHQLFAWCSLVLGDVRGHLRPPLLDGRLITDLRIF